jgi:hypothetical protein
MNPGWWWVFLVIIIIIFGTGLVVTHAVHG